MIERLKYRDDVFVSPHHDDVCFSLGYFAYERHAGTLLNVFSVSDFRVDYPFRDSRNARETTRKRLSEDFAFASICGLNVHNLHFVDARARGHASRDTRQSPAIADAICDRLIRSLIGQRIGRREEPKPRLFCPSGIGSHVDHVAVLLAIVANFQLLQKHYRIAFYEDLHYASNPAHRQNGLHFLDQLLTRNGINVKRLWLELDDNAQMQKMRLIRNYSSQLTPEIDTLGAYTPAIEAHAFPHEALWILQDEDMHQAFG